MSETAVETEPEKGKKRKTALPGMLRKFGESVKKIEIAFQLEQANVSRDDERMRAMINTAASDAGVSIERILRNSKIMNESDNRAFAQSKKWRV